MPGYKEDWELKPEGVVQVVVVDDDGGAENDPDRNDGGSRQSDGLSVRTGSTGRGESGWCTQVALELLEFVFGVVLLLVVERNRGLNILVVGGHG